MGLLVLAGCSAGAAGDWRATSATSEAGDSVASGILEIDRDGEVLLELVMSGDGPIGTLDGSGVGSVSGSSATFMIAADWSGGGLVTVDATCDADGDAMSCAVDVDDDAWTVDFIREAGVDLGID